MSPNIALVGCGAIAQKFYLPVLAKHRRQFGKIWMVDPSDNARHMACSIIEAGESSTLADVLDDLQFVIIASPNAHHFSAARDALNRDAHLLIEKPFVIWPEEGRALIELAAKRRRIIAINQPRRLFPHARELRKRVAAGEFGALTSISHNEGTKLDWPFSSGASFARGAQRTGIIMDIGVHVLDFYQYLLDPIWEFVSAIHDGFNGPEGLGELRLKANDALVSIRLSRYQKQDNAALLEFADARVRVDLSEPSAYYVTSKASGRERRCAVKSPPVDFAFLSEAMLANFLAAGAGQEKPICDAASSLPVIQILDEIYKRAFRYPDILGAV